MYTLIMKLEKGFIVVGLFLGLPSCTTQSILPPELLTSNSAQETLCPDGIVSFKYDIHPLIVSNCAFSGCHDAKTAAYDIVLETYDQIMEEVKPGDPGESELYEVLVDTGDEIMPPPPYDPLPQAQIELVKRWIMQGALQTTCGDGCVPEEASFLANILPTMELYCIGCHKTGNLQGNVNLETYDLIKKYADNGQLLGTINHQPGHNPMPPSGFKIPDCRITQLQNWIDGGTQKD